VQVLGKFGFAAIPAAVRQACLIQATRIYKRRDAPFGVTGSAEMGTLQILGRIDPDVASLLSGLMRMV
jgi:hypothetical protein